MKNFLHKTKSLTALLTLITLLFLPGVGWGQTTVFSDDFSTDLSATWTTSGQIGSSAFSVTRSGADWGARRNTSPAQLELTNDVGATANAAGWAFSNAATSGFSTPYNTTLSSNPGLVTWYFNIRQIRPDPAGFTSTSYGVAYVLGGTSATAATAGDGYAVALGGTGITDPVRLVKYTTGLQPLGSTQTGIIVSNTSGLTDFGAEYLSVKVTYNPSNNQWELFLRNDGASAFADPMSGTLTSQGTATDNTYTSTALAYMGAYWQGSTGATQTAFFDNVTVQVTSGGVSAPTTQASNITFGSVGQNGMTTSWTNGNGAKRVVIMNTSNSFTNPTDGTDPTANTTYSGSGEQVVYNGSGNSVAVTGLTASTTYWYRVYEYNGSGTGTLFLTITATDNPKSQATSAPAPLITVTGTFTPFATAEGTPSASQSVAVSGSNLTGNINVSALAGYEYSTTDAAPWTTTLSLSPSFSGNVYVRLTGASGGTFIGTISFTSTGATQVDKTVSGTVACAPATFPFVENFSYTTGTTLAANCWNVHSAGGNPITVQVSTITYPGYLSSEIGGQITVTAGSTGEDVSRTFTAQTSGDVYVSFLVNVTSATTTGDYFFHLGQTVIGSTFRGRIFVKNEGSGNIAFGIAQSTTPVNYTAFSYALNTTYLIVLKYNIVSGATNDVASIFINPVLNAIEPSIGWIANTDASGTDLTEVGSVAIRQGGASSNPALIIDGIRISNSWSDIVGPASTTWDGSASNDWHTSDNWSAGIPTSNMDVIIPFTGITNFPTLSAAGTCKNITIASGATLLDNGNLTVTGTATAEREIAGAEQWHLLSSPVASQAISGDWTPAGSYGDGTGYDFYAWNESNIALPWLNQKVGGNGITTFVPGQGYLVAYQVPGTKAFTGTLNTGSVTFNLKNSGLKSWTYNTGWNLIGNPYPSAIDWNLVTRTPFQDEFAYIYNGTAYTPVDGSAANAYIAANQGFFVLADVASNNQDFSFTNATRTHGGSFLKNTGVDDKFVIRLANENYADNTTIRFREQSIPQRDRLDALKLFSFSAEVPQVYTRTTDGINVAVNSIPGNGEVLSIPLSIKAPANGNMSVSLQDVEGAFTGQTIFLRDQLTGILHNLSNNPTYSFTATQGDDETRFTLHFSTVGIDNPTTGNPVQVYANNGLVYLNGVAAGAEVTISDITGRVVKQLRTSGDGLTTLNVSNLPRGMYIVNIISGKDLQSRKIIL